MRRHTRLVLIAAQRERRREYIAAGSAVAWDDYRELVSPILDRHDDITGVFWVPMVDTDALARFEQIADAGGPPGFDLQYGSGDIPVSETESWPIYSWH